MYFAFPLIGVIFSWIGLNHVGPPNSFGEWNPVSVFLWLAFMGFGARLIAALFQITPNEEGSSDEDR